MKDNEIRSIIIGFLSLINQGLDIYENWNQKQTDKSRIIGLLSDSGKMFNL
jgi:hypothetical protein